MSTETQAPKLRSDMEVIPTYYQGQKALIVRDSLGLIKSPVVLQGQILEFIGLLDGTRTPRDIQLELIRRQNGVFMGFEDVQSLLSQLDVLFLLDSDRYRDKKNEIFAEYSRQPTRPAVLADQAYPKSRESLEKYLDSFFTGIPADATDGNSRKVSALIAPHIDLRVGQKVYTQAYAAIRDVSPKRVLILGTGHSLHKSYFSLTEKDFETPLGMVKTDKAFVRKLKEADDNVLAPDDLDHRNEHSIEFQLLFLQHLFGSDFTLVPILCGSMDSSLSRFSCASEIPGVSGLLSELKNYVEERGPDILVVAGVDFSHIGPKFGHSYKASGLIAEAKNHDTRLIDAICRGDGAALWAEAKRVDNRYNVCGFSSLACLLEIFPGAVGHCLAYEFWEEDKTQSAVSYAAMTLSPAC